MTQYIGIDPGGSGAIAILTSGGEAYFVKHDQTETDIAAFLQVWTSNHVIDSFALIERVSASPQMGVVSAFKFGKSYGFLRGLLAGLQIPFDEISPAKWQAAMGCLTKGDKNITKQKAQQLFPSVKITHANADALLIAECLRRIKTGQLIHAQAV